MKFFQVEIAPREGNRILLLPFGMSLRVHFDAAKPISEWNDKVFLTMNQDGATVDAQPVSGEVAAVSERCKDLLESVAPGAIQFLSVRTRTMFGEEVSDSKYLVNYLCKCDVLDKTRSTAADNDWSKQGGNYQYLMKPVLNAKKATKFPIFRIRGADDIVVYREDVVRAIQSEGLTGFSFTEIQADA